MRLASCVLLIATCLGCGNGSGGGAPPAQLAGGPLIIPLPVAPVDARPVAVTDGAQPDASTDLPIAKSEPRERVEETAKRHRSPILDGAPRATRLPPGTYGCRSDAGYKYRPCTIAKDPSGFTHITMPGSLINLVGVLYDDGPALVIDGTNGDLRPFGCFICQERCSDEPGSCYCTEIHPDASRECLGQPLTVRLTKVGAIWRGTLSLVHYSNHYEGTGADRRPKGWDKERQSFVVEIAPESLIPKK